MHVIEDFFWIPQKIKQPIILVLDNIQNCLAKASIKDRKGRGERSGSGFFKFFHIKLSIHCKKDWNKVRKNIC